MGAIDRSAQLGSAQLFEAPSAAVWPRDRPLQAFTQAPPPQAGSEGRRQRLERMEEWRN